MSHWYLDYAYFNSAKCLSSTGMSSGRLSDEVAIVTGAGRNIGQTIAETFAAEGAYVIVADVDKEAATAVVDGITDAGGEAVAAATDVTDPSDVAAMIETAEEEFGPVDILINNAAINERKGLFDITIDEFDRTLETNLRGTFLCTREAAKSMEKKRWRPNRQYRFCDVRSCWSSGSNRICDLQVGYFQFYSISSKSAFRK